ncbi:hypothetical protein HS088_TW22G00404 [Tripterygium wilfordii]|uniref:ZZ-type domain-containing protein n=1 Tax=Tripterygium wilfordii TaxID=458696 RepID=A0A7J7BXW4_TRIWF|nr:hypothetical protein HS088_TW22G00404 [Tripterygium wilfordii]
MLMVMESPQVIKVKFQDTLMRFTLYYDEDGLLDLNMLGLKDKIRTFYNFGPAMDLNLTYIDEDSDVVTLVDDDDLDEAVRQNLNPLRITVFSSIDSISSKPSQESSISMTGVSLIVAKLEECSSRFSKLEESMSKLTKLEECMSKFTNLGFDLEHRSGGNRGDRMASDCPMGPQGAEDLRESSIDVAEPKAFSSANVEELTQITNQKGKEDSNAVGSVAISVPPTNSHVDIKVNCHEDSVEVASPDKNTCPKEVPVLAGVEQFPGVKVASNLHDISPQNEFAAENVFPPWYDNSYPIKKSYYHQDIHDRVFHGGVQCDGCGMLPIVGSRFKSIVREDYDLCITCFRSIGKDDEYIKLNLPQSFQFHNSDEKRCGPPHSLEPWCTMPDAPKGPRCFDGHIALSDGSVIAPNISVAKICKMRNKGSTIWSFGTRLEWIGGDKFTEEVSVELQVPLHGCGLGEELDVVVNFIAPERSDLYVSFWRMLSPFGYEFVQKFSLLIEVSYELNHFSVAGCN